MDKLLFNLFFFLVASAILWVPVIVAAGLIRRQVRRLREHNLSYDLSRQDRHLVVTTAFSILTGGVFLLLFLAVFDDKALQQYFRIFGALSYFVMLLPWLMLLVGGVAAALRQRWGHYLLTVTWLMLLIGLPLTAPAFYFLWVLLFHVRTLAWFYREPPPPKPVPVPEP